MSACAAPYGWPPRRSSACSSIGAFRPRGFKTTISPGSHWGGICTSTACGTPCSLRLPRERCGCLDRIHFLALSGLFGSESSRAYRVCGFATWIVALTLVLLIGEKLTGSRAAGVLAALLWAANANSVPSIVWISAYYQLLMRGMLAGGAVFAFAGWHAAGWVCYLAAFGAMEIAPFRTLPVAPAAMRIAHRNAKQVPAALCGCSPFQPYFIRSPIFFIRAEIYRRDRTCSSLDSRLPSTDTIANTSRGSSSRAAPRSVRTRNNTMRRELLLGTDPGSDAGLVRDTKGCCRHEWIAGLVLRLVRIGVAGADAAAAGST